VSSQPPLYVKGELQADGGEAFCAANGYQMVEFDQPVNWNWGTGEPISWARWKLPAPVFDAAIHMDGIRNIQRRPASPSS
jgi:hypothetical protein